MRPQTQLFVFPNGETLKPADPEAPDFSPEQKLVLGIINQAVRDLESLDCGTKICATRFFTAPSKAWDLMFDAVGIDRTTFVTDYLQPRGLLLPNVSD